VILLPRVVQNDCASWPLVSANCFFDKREFRHQIFEGKRAFRRGGVRRLFPPVLERSCPGNFLTECSFVWKKSNSPSFLRRHAAPRCAVVQLEWRAVASGLSPPVSVWWCLFVSVVSSCVCWGLFLPALPLLRALQQSARVVRCSFGAHAPRRCVPCSHSLSISV